MSTYLYRLARFAFQHRRQMLALWLVLAVATIVIATVSGGKTNDNFTIPGTESQRAADLLTKKLPALSGGQAQVVFSAKSGTVLTDPTSKAGIEAAVADLKKVPQVVSVSDPFTANAVSSNGQVALSSVQFSAQPTDVKDSTLDAVKAAVVPAQDAGVEVNYSGSAYPGWRTVPSELPELIGIVVAFLILLVTFGAVVTAGLPIITAVIGVVVTLMGVTAVAAVINIASASTTVALMLGLSCGIDYGVFILYRHRNNLLTGMTVEDSVSLAVGTAGSSVVFAALTVIIALCGLSVVGIPFLTVMGLAAAAAVLVALLIALTLLPAMLGFAGPRIAKFINTPLRPGHHEEVARTSAIRPEHTFGASWARFVVRYRVPVLILGVVLLGVLAIPAASLQLGLPSGSSKPTSDTQRKAYDLTTAGFGAGFNGPLLVVADGVTASSATDQMAATLRTLPGVVSATPVAAQNGVSVIKVIPSTFILLTFAFRTILVPIKSIIGFLLSVSAAFGAQVAMFQWGWGRHIFGITPSETISFLPILMLAIIFGLSSDYEVFVVSRIKEDFTRTGDARGAVARGTGLSARVVTAAALIMFSIFVAFMFTTDPTIKAIGFSFAVGVFLDAFVVRLALVPATMAIVRAKLWYHPQWFAKYIPDPDIEGERLQKQREAAAAASTGPTQA